MNAPRIALEVGELVLDGLEISQAEKIEPAVNRELARLFFLMGGRPWMKNQQELSLPDVTIEVPPDSRPEQIGVRIARDIFNKMNTSRPPEHHPRGGRR